MGTLGVMFKVAHRRLVHSNPVTGVDRPRVDQAEMQVLSGAGITRLLVAYGELEREADQDEERGGG